MRPPFLDAERLTETDLRVLRAPPFLDAERLTETDLRDFAILYIYARSFERGLQMTIPLNTMDDIFPTKEGVDYNKLKITDEGEYSVTRKRDGERILSCMLNILGPVGNKIITDVTGCVGGDTLNFALAFNHVFAIESNHHNYDALVNNVDVYGFKNVDVYWKDSTTFFNWYTDVLYIDPPWGGPRYKDYDKLDLYMSTFRLDEWLELILLRENRPKYIFMKLPQNYNFGRLTFLSNIDSIKQFQVRRYTLLAIIVNPSKSHRVPLNT